MEHTWNISVPIPAQNKVTETVRPLVKGSLHALWKYPATSIGTSIVAPNIANICCIPSISILGIPSWQASRTAS